MAIEIGNMIGIGQANKGPATASPVYGGFGATPRATPKAVRALATYTCERKLRRLANEYRRLQQRMAECQAQSAYLRRRLASMGQDRGPATASPVYGGFGAQPGAAPVRLPRPKPFGR